MDGIFTEEELKADVTSGAEELTPPVEETAEQKEQRERDELGRFKAKEGGEEQPGAEEEGKEKGGTVPVGALHSEREKRKTSDAERDAAKAEIARLQEQLGAIQKMREQVASRKPEDLPAADDPAAVEHLRKRLAEVEQQTTRFGQERDAEALNNQELQQLGSFMHQSETAYRAQQPDYDEAINHVVQARAQELALYGLSVPQIQQTISEEATEIVRSAVAQGRDPAELGYQIAKSRGYVPKQTEANPEVKTNGGAQAMLDAIATAQAKSKSLGSGGSAVPARLTAEAIAALTQEEVEILCSTPEGMAAFDRVLQGN